MRSTEQAVPAERPSSHRWFGAIPAGDGTDFQVWAPAARRVELLIDRGAGRFETHVLPSHEPGLFSASIAGVRAGDRYLYRLDGAGPYPDPASRFQPFGVHGPSEVVDAGAFAWTDRAWPGVTPERLIIYELHVGTFTPKGTFEAAAERLPYLADLGVTVVELMPVADFAGDRNWGYDGVALYAPARCYGRPDDLRRFVDRAHRLGLAVHLDVVYNHLGPDGAYLTVFSPQFLSDRHSSPWGAGVNLDGPGSAIVRDFLIGSALHWIREYHVDGLRLDATHALSDDSPSHFLAELSSAVHAAGAGRPVVSVAEDHRNLARMLQPREQGGWNLDGVWADDFHHEIRRMLSGDSEGYYADFTGSIRDLATTIRQGWLFCGQYSMHAGGPRGTDPDAVPLRKFVVCLQNHDQVGNRALGERLNHQVEAPVFRAASTLLALVPETPLIFMGQEWAAGTPFQYFTDHRAELGVQITEGRRREFRHFSAFFDPKTRARIPDPQSSDTFAASRLAWEELDAPAHAAVRRLYRRLLRLRAAEPALHSGGRADLVVEPLDDDTLFLRRSSAGAPPIVAVIRMREPGSVVLRPSFLEAPGTGRGDDRRWQVVLTTEDEEFASDGRPPLVDLAARPPAIRFFRPGAVILRMRV